MKIKFKKDESFHHRLSFDFPDIEIRKKVLNIENLSEEELQELVVKNRNVIVYIKNPSEKVKRLAIENYPNYAPFVLGDISVELQNLCIDKFMEGKWACANWKKIELPLDITDKDVLKRWEKMVNVPNILG